MSYIYIIQSGKKGPYKIGIARDVEKRMSGLQTGNPEELHIIAKFYFSSHKQTAKIEKILHNKFRKMHIRGEWFSNKIRLSLIDDCFKTDFNNQRKIKKDEKINDFLDIGLMNKMPDIYNYIRKTK